MDGRIESDSVIGHSQVYCVRLSNEFDSGMARATMLDYVLQRFLCGAEQAERNALRELLRDVANDA